MSKSILGPVLAASALGLFISSSFAACGGDTVTTGPTSSSSSSSTGGGGGSPTSSTSSTGGTGAEGGGGTGGAMNTGADTCPGDPYTLSLGTTLVLAGDTSLGNNDYTQGCAAAPLDGPDMVYELTVADAGTLSVDLASAGTLDPAMYFRTACDDSNTLRWCNDFSPTLRTRKVNINPGTYYLIVDGASQSQGPYTLTLDLQAAACGDGVLNPDATPPEQCDDGNTDTGDGCANCILEAGSNDDCSDPLGPIVIQANTLVTLSGNTTGNNDSHAYVVDLANQDCTSTYNFGGGRDRVYHLVANATGTMTIDIGYPVSGGSQTICEINQTDPGCWNSVLYVRHVDGQSDQAACETSTSTSQLGCVEQLPPANGGDTITFAAVAGESYFVFVDSWWYDAAGGYTGPYNLHVNLQ